MNKRKNCISIIDTCTVHRFSKRISNYMIFESVDSPSSAAANCTTPLLGNFRYTVTSSLGVSSCGMAPGDGYLGVCEGDSKTVIYNYTTCNTRLGFSGKYDAFIIVSPSSLTLSQTNLCFDVSEVQVFWKHWGKHWGKGEIARNECNFLFFHSVF